MAEEATADQELVREIQKGLTEHGYGTHAPDGVYGPATRWGVQRVLRESGWNDPDGDLTPDVVHVLNEVLELGWKPTDLSTSLRELEEAFADGPANVFAPAVYLIHRHPQWAGGAAASFRTDPATGFVRRPIEEWIADVRTLYVPQATGQLDGRKVLVGLALLDRDLRGVLEEDGFLNAIEAEIEDFPRQLSGRGKALHTPDAVPTLSDQPSDVDNLGRKAFAEALGARLIDEQSRSAQAKVTPKLPKGEADSFVLHLEGPWGSGKTSLLRFLSTYLTEQGWLVVQFNAWQHQRVGAPWWLLIAEVHREAVRSAPWPLSWWLRLRSVAWRASIARWRIAGLLAAIALFVVALFVARDQDVPGGAALITVVATAVTTVAAGINALRGLGGAFSSRQGADQFVRQAADPMNTLERRFCGLVRSIGKPVAVFVDDLDRCRPPYVVELLEGIQTVLREPPVTFVIAADRHWLYDSYEQVYPEHRGDGRDPGRPLGHLFLEKTFQLSTSVPRLSLAEREEFWRSLIFPSAEPEDAAQLEQRLAQEFAAARTEEETFTVLDRLSRGSPAERRAARAVAVRKLSTPELVQATEHTLSRFAPLLEPNPRAMKRLVNAYGVERALQIIGGHSTALDYPRERLALWTILKSRWPLLADFLADEPDTIEQLKAGEVPPEVVAAAARPYLAALFADDEVHRVVSGSVIGVDLDANSLRLLIEGPAAAEVVHA